MSTAPTDLTPEAAAALQAACDRIGVLWGPPPKFTVTQWAEKHRIIAPGASARPGPWITESYQREIQDSVTDPLVGRIVVEKSTQLGWSEMLNNVIGYFMHADPKPQMLVQPRESDAKKYSRKRIAPMIDSCPALKERVSEAKSRDGANTMLLKEYEGGFLTIGSANSPASLRSDPVAILLEDEVDGYPLDADGEGAPSEIAEHRTETFDDAKVLIGSTPAKPKGVSLIESEYQASSQGLFHVPCPQCNHMQPLYWRDPESGLYHLTYERERGDVINESVRYICRACQYAIDERYKQRMLDAGAWVHKFPDRKDGRGLFIRGYHLHAMYSPWRPIWASLAQKWVKAQDNPEKLKAFVNLSLGETFDESGEAVESNTLAVRKEQYQEIASIPAAACVLVATCDVQANRVEIQHTAFGPGEESWLIDHHVVWGDPGHDSTWDEVDEWLLNTYKHESGATLVPSIVLIDSGDGGNTDNVYDFVLPRQNTRRHVFAIKGVDYLSKPGLAAEGTTKRSRVRLFTVGTFACKDRIFARLRLVKPGPGYIHIPDWATDEYLEQMTAERKQPVRNRTTRKTKYVYVKVSPRNEALDLWVYAHAALFILQNFIDPKTYRNLDRLQGVVQGGHTPGAPTGRKTRRMRSSGI